MTTHQIHKPAPHWQSEPKLKTNLSSINHFKVRNCWSTSDHTSCKLLNQDLCHSSFWWYLNQLAKTYWKALEYLVGWDPHLYPAPDHIMATSSCSSSLRRASLISSESIAFMKRRKDLDKIYAGWIRDAERQLDPRKNEQETMDTSTLI